MSARELESKLPASTPKERSVSVSKPTLTNQVPSTPQVVDSQIQNQLSKKNQIINNAIQKRNKRTIQFYKTQKIKSPPESKGSHRYQSLSQTGQDALSCQHVEFDKVSDKNAHMASKPIFSQIRRV